MGTPGALPDGSCTIPPAADDETRVTSARPREAASWRRRLALAALGLVLVALAADFVSQRLALARMAELIRQDLAEVVGLEVTLDELYVDLLPLPSLQASGVHVANLPGRTRPHLLEIGTLQIQIELLPLLLHRSVVVEGIEVEDVDLTIERDAAGGFDLPLELAELIDERPGDEGDGVSFRARALRARNLRAFHIGADGHVTSLVVDELDADGASDPDSVRFETWGALDGSPFALSGRLGRLTELLGPTGPFPVDLRGRIFETTVGLRGSIRDISRFEGLDLELEVELSELAWSGAPRIDLGRVRFEGVLSDADGTLGLEAIRARTLEDRVFTGELEGRVDDLRRLRDVSILLGVSSPDVDFLGPILPFAAPELDHMRMSLELADADGSLGVSGEVRLELRDEQGWLELSGGYGDVTRLSDLDVRFELFLTDADRLFALFDQPSRLPPGVPGHASGRLVGRGDVLGLEDLDLLLGHEEAAWIRARGSIQDLLAVQGVAIDLAYRVDSLPTLGRLIGRELPEIGPVEGTAALVDDDGSLGLEQLELHSQGQSSGVTLDLSATLDDLLALDDIQTDLKLRAPDLQVVGALTGLTLPALGPVELEARVSGSNELLVARDLVLQLGETRLAGAVEASFSAWQRPAIVARLASTRVRLADLGITGEGLALLLASGGGSSEPMDLGALRAVDLDLDLRVQNTVGVEGLEFQDLHAVVLLEDGALNGDLDLLYQLGQVEALLLLDASTPRPQLSARVEATAIDIALLLNQFELEDEFSGLLDLYLDVASTGRRGRTLLQNLEGRAQLAIRDAIFISEYAQEFVVDLADAVMENFIYDPDEEARIGCAAARLGIASGVATVERMLLEEEEITVTGTGTIDLVAGEWDLLLTPTTSRPGVVSVAPEVRVTGPLARPRFSSVKRTVATSLGRGLLSGLRDLGTLALGPFSSRGETIREGRAICGRIGGAAPDGRVEASARTLERGSGRRAPLAPQPSPSNP